ncbi:MAG: hypothetical protein ACYC1S_12300 [Gemmatimonadaceae bacterium]
MILAIHPKANFWEQWYVCIETDYRNIVVGALRDAVNEQRGRLLGDRFCKFPLIGWIVCGTISVVGEAMGYVLGALLDANIGTYVNGFPNTVGRLVAAYFALFEPDKLQINAVTMEQKALQASLGTTIRSARAEILHNGVTSELQLQPWLSDVGLPVPAPPGLAAPDRASPGAAAPAAARVLVAPRIRARHLPACGVAADSGFGAVFPQTWGTPGSCAGPTLPFVRTSPVPSAAPTSRIRSSSRTGSGSYRSGSRFPQAPSTTRRARRSRCG